MIKVYFHRPEDNGYVIVNIVKETDKKEHILDVYRSESLTQFEIGEWVKKEKRKYKKIVFLEFQTGKGWINKTRKRRKRNEK